MNRDKRQYLAVVGKRLDQFAAKDNLTSSLAFDTERPADNPLAKIAVTIPWEGVRFESLSEDETPDDDLRRPVRRMCLFEIPAELSDLPNPAVLAAAIYRSLMFDDMFILAHGASIPTMLFPKLEG